MATATSPSPPVEPLSAHRPEPQPTPIKPAGDELFRISLEAYRQMGEAGILRRSDRVVLLDGLLVKKMTKGPRHTLAVYATNKLLMDRLPVGYHPKTEAPVEIQPGPDGDSAPEPDVTVIRGAAADYRDRHPGPGDVLLVVEVADSSVRLDRRGLRRYAWANIPTAWIVNLRAGTVEVYTSPSGPVADPGYAEKVTRSIGQTLDIPLDGQTLAGLAVADLFG